MHRTLNSKQCTCAQAYAFPAMDLDLKLVRTNLAPRTIVRAPGFTNSVMIIEQVLQLCCRLLQYTSLVPFGQPSLALHPLVQALHVQKQDVLCSCQITCKVAGSQVMEHVASHLGADPVRVRQLNFLPKYPFPTPPSPSLWPTLAASPSSPLPPNGQGPASGQQLTVSGCGRVSGWKEPPERRIMYTSLGRCAPVSPAL